jgi:hypothetical protein
MLLKKAIFLFVFFSFIIPLSAIQQTPNSSTQAAGSQAGAASAAENAQIRQLGNSGNDAQALRDDIRKMRALVHQMETNLAFVDTTQSPLKHQLQLDIDMWNILINQMERRSYSNSR